MDGVSASSVSQSIDSLNRILEMASKESLDMAKKLMKVTVQAAVGKESGKGVDIDTSA